MALYGVCASKNPADTSGAAIAIIEPPADSTPVAKARNSVG
eukprot:CAMPEP_0169211210 /NCGR_PEP_ID=MMETSP1016-20121227/15629_1 /TAXON_ID=342587 /ORGANISM="Karlodinium micrum, Strain CCMP2283" /LENGTH=40 /DNA_ID= /DNA_START= /DNA_END= /DNA_ORIENTATION=